MNMPNGIHAIPREDYDCLQRANWSSIKQFGKSPAHYRHALLEKQEDTDAKQRGRVSHLATLEPERFRSEVVVWDMGARRGKDWSAFQDRHRGKEIITEGMNEAALAISRSARSHPVASKWLSGGRTEISVLWTHMRPDMGGVPGFSFDCKGMLDMLREDAIVDLKSTKDASPSGFARECARYGYHGQAAIYTDGIKAVSGKRLPYIVVAVEVAPPHVVQVYRMPDELLELGGEMYRTYLDQLWHCRQTNSWPGYADAEMDLTLPKWATPYNDDEDVTGLDLVIGG